MSMPSVTTPTPSASPVISVNQLGKCYYIYDRPQDRLKQAVIPRLHRLVTRRERAPYFREFWALRDVSFTVERGSAMAIIGRNGAGKSTLLQMIAGTLTPTCGSVAVHGRVAALLELGSGFNPEFTGRENVFLNASLLGLSTAETEVKFEEIADFADIGDFIEQPVKTYSSGMLMRLAFAVQTAVVPEVLIVDEALSVGDVFFQAKCIARMERLLSDGVSLLWVSHDPGTVRQLCDKAILLEGGQALCAGDVAEVTDRYLHLQLEERNRKRPVPRSMGMSVQPVRSVAGTPTGASSAPVIVAGSQGASIPPSVAPASSARDALLEGASAFVEKARFNRAGNHSARFENVQMLKEGRLANAFDYGDIVTLRQVVRFNVPLKNVNVSYKIRTPQGTDIVFGDTRLADAMSVAYNPGVYVFDWTFRVDLMHGIYVVMSGLAHPPSTPGEDWLFIDVVPICYDFRMLGRRGGMIDGFITWDSRLQVERIEEAL